MSEKIQEYFMTTDGTEVKKMDVGGDTEYYAGGEEVSAQSFAAYASHKPTVEKFNRGNLENVDSVEELGHPFDADTISSIDQYPRGSVAREQQADANKFLGFVNERGEDPSLAEAEAYTNFVDEIEDAASPAEEAKIREKYNLGGSP